MSFRSHQTGTDHPEPRTTGGLLLYLTIPAIFVIGMVDPLLMLGGVMTVGILTVIGMQTRACFGLLARCKKTAFEPSGLA